ncbi:MAG: hypothetical protein CBR30_00575 [Dictyoglomus sp. NZ13-RE01]|nr:MAG: hypothetical protein CBR30_00575 [Dictyoglomus sp. NZ13-RE01]
MKWKFKNCSEIKKFLTNNKVFVFSCSGCNTEDIEEKNRKIEEFLKDCGLERVGIINLEPEMCNIYSLREILSKEFPNNIENILTFTCGGLPQVLPSYIKGNIIPAIDPLKMELGKKLGSFARLCVYCGECWIHYTGNLCMEKLCPKKMRNGPCGGAKDGFCEVYDKRLCPFVILFKKDNERAFQDLIPPKDFSVILLQE